MINSCLSEIKNLKGTVIRQELIINECKNEIAELQRNNMRNNLIISGIPRMEKEDCKQQISAFLKEIMGIDDAILIRNAYRRGPGKKAPIQVNLSRFEDKLKIFSKVNTLKDKKNVYDEAYSVEDQLPAKMKEKKRRRRTLMVENKKKTVDKLIMSFEKGKLILDQEEYECQVPVPSLKSVLQPTTKEPSGRLAISTSVGKTITKNGSKFIGYSVAVAKIHSLNCRAHHVICAFRIPHEKYHIYQDY